MPSLDRQTLERLADLIVGDEPWAPKARGSYELSLFFEEAGFDDAVHDGSSKRPWVIERLKSAHEDGLAAAILRLASPKEYGGDVHQHASAVAALNAILAVEGMQVRIGPDLLPRLEQIEPNYAPPIVTMNGVSSLDQPNFMALGDGKYAALLEARWREAKLCFESGAYMAAIIMIGSVLETVLLVALRRNYRALSERGIEVRDQNGAVKPLQQWSLGDMIDACHRLGWTSAMTKRFEHVLREYRNLVHPEVQLKNEFDPGSEECRIAALVVSAVTRDVSNRFAKYKVAAG